MMRAGIFFLIIGIASFVLPMMDMQLRIMRIFGDATPIAGAVAIVIGIALISLNVYRARARRL